MKGLVITMVVGAVLFFLGSNTSSSIENPSSLRGYSSLGRYYADMGQYKKVIANGRAMIGKYPNTREAEKGWLAIGSSYNYLMREAMAELEKAKARADATAGEIKQLEARVNSYMNGAISSYRKVIGQFSHFKAEAVLGIGGTYAARGSEKAAEAQLQYQKVVDSFPEEAGRAKLRMGDLYLNEGDLGKAKQMYTMAQASFPEVASLAKLKQAGCYFDAGDFGRASDGYQEIIDYLGIDGAYSASYYPLGSVMGGAVEKRGEAEKALKNIENELNGYKAVISRFPGTNISMKAQLELAEAYWSNGKREEAAKLLRGVASDYQKSVWAGKALFRLAELQGNSMDGVKTYQAIIGYYPESRLWVEAQMRLAETYLKLADEEVDPVEKKRLKGEAQKAYKVIIATYPFCQEGEEARDSLKKIKL